VTAAPTDAQPDVFVTDRECGECGMCCKLFAIEALGKPANVWCVNYRPGQGCGIYETRPAPCRAFECGYLVYGFLDDSWRPDRCHFFIWLDERRKLMVIEVDPAYPDAWRKAPFYGALKQWSRRTRPDSPGFCAKVGQQITMVFPEADIPLGLHQDRPIRSGYRMGPGGRYEPFAAWA
jgi:hypothetical protein